MVARLPVPFEDSTTTMLGGRCRRTWRGKGDFTGVVEVRQIRVVVEDSREYGRRPVVDVEVFLRGGLRTLECAADFCPHSGGRMSVLRCRLLRAGVGLCRAVVGEGKEA